MFYARGLLFYYRICIESITAFRQTFAERMCNTLRTAVKLATLEASVTDVRRDETSGVGAEESSNTLYVNQYISSPPEYKLIPEFLGKMKTQEPSPTKKVPI